VTPALALALACGLLVASAEPVEVRPVDLNRATLEELQHLPGIGPRKAEAIVDLRKKRPFTRVTQLLEVKGVGRKTLERLKPWVFVAPAVPMTTGAPSAAAPAPTAP
jgi:competence ComEA-like helix-hairpin-helix protein